MAERRPIVSEFRDDEEMRELVQLFVEEMPEKVDRLRASWETGSAEELQRLAHQLKGSSGGYGFGVIGEAAAALERPLKEGETELERLRREFEALVDLCNRAQA